MLEMSHPALAHPAFSCKWQHEKGLAAFFSLCQPIRKCFTSFGGKQTWNLLTFLKITWFNPSGALTIFGLFSLTFTLCYGLSCYNWIQKARCKTQDQSMTLYILRDVRVPWESTFHLLFLQFHFTLNGDPFVDKKPCWKKCTWYSDQWHENCTKNACVSAF